MAPKVLLLEVVFVVEKVRLHLRDVVVAVQDLQAREVDPAIVSKKCQSLTPIEIQEATSL